MNSWTIGKRLYGCFGTLFLLLLVLGVSTISSITSLTEDMDRVVIRTAEARFLCSRVQGAATEMGSIERGMLTRSMVQDTAGVAELQNQFTAALTLTGKELAQVNALIQN